MNLSKNFTLEELTRSEYATRKGLDNSPDAKVLANLTTLAEGLERVRFVLGHSVHVTSGYRSPRVNTGIGGSKTSQHVLGLAADFVCPGYGRPIDICQMLIDNEEYIDFDQLIDEDSWIHISFGSPRRHEILTAHFGGGKVVYTKGLLPS